MKLSLGEVICHHHNMVPHRRPSLHSCSRVLSCNLYIGLLVLLPEHFLQRVKYFHGRFLVFKLHSQNIRHACEPIGNCLVVWSYPLVKLSFDLTGSSVVRKRWFWYVENISYILSDQHNVEVWFPFLEIIPVKTSFDNSAMIGFDILNSGNKTYFKLIWV